MTEPSPYLIRPFEPGDEVSILDSFNRTFSEVDPNFKARTMEEWRWAFDENPSGRRIVVAVKDGQVACQNAALPMRVLIGDEQCVFGQSVDSFVHPDHRRGLRRPGIFVKTVWEFIDTFGGSDKDYFHYGLPIWPAWRIGKTYLKYELVRTQLKLMARTDKISLPPLGPGGSGVDVREITEFPEDSAQLFRKHAARTGAMAVRDKAQLDWRFANRPGKPYAIAEARRGGELVGLTVQRMGGFDGDEGSLVCDWVVGSPEGHHAPFDLGASVELIAWHRTKAIEAGAEKILALFPETVPEWLAFQEAGFRARDTSYFVVGRNYVKQYDMLWLRQNWYYTLGDTDLC